MGIHTPDLEKQIPCGYPIAELALRDEPPQRLGGTGQGSFATGLSGPRLPTIAHSGGAPGQPRNSTLPALAGWRRQPRPRGAPSGSPGQPAPRPPPDPVSPTVLADGSSTRRSRRAGQRAGSRIARRPLDQAREPRRRHSPIRNQDSSVMREKIAFEE